MRTAFSWQPDDHQILSENVFKRRAKFPCLPATRPQPVGRTSEAVYCEAGKIASVSILFPAEFQPLTASHASSDGAPSNDAWSLAPVRPPQSSWIAPSAVVMGRVRIGEHCIVLPTAVVRGDTEEIHLGEGSNVQDACILHADPQFPCHIGRRCSLGHRAVVHGATVEDDCLIGIGAIVLNGAVIGQGSLIAAGTLIPEGKQIPPGSVVMGIPGKVVRQTTEADLARIRHAANHYRNSIAAYQKTSGG